MVYTPLTVYTPDGVPYWRSTLLTDYSTKHTTHDPTKAEKLT